MHDQSADRDLTDALLNEISLKSHPMEIRPSLLLPSSFRRRATLLLIILGWPVIAEAQVASEVVLHSFGGAAMLDGAFADSTPLLASDGALYGTTWGGGNQGGGTVFRLNTDGTGYTILHHFGFAPDASAPFSSVIQGSEPFL